MTAVKRKSGARAGAETETEESHAAEACRLRPRILPDLAKQIRRAASSVTLNIAEGSKRRGEDRLYLYSVAAGSANEVLAALDTADAWGWTSGAPDVRDTYDHMLGIQESTRRSSGLASM